MTQGDTTLAITNKDFLHIKVTLGKHNNKFKTHRKNNKGEIKKLKNQKDAEII